MFRRLDYTLWRATAHNPVRMLSVVSRAKLEAAAADPEFLALYDRAIAALDEARTARNTWWTTRFPHLAGPVDRLLLGGVRAASVAADLRRRSRRAGGRPLQGGGDLGVPLVGVGFMYPQGYFHQHVSAEGWQEESYERLNWADAPIEPALTRRRQAVRHGGAARRAVGARGGLARAHRPRAALPARHRPRGERALGSRAVGAAVRRRSRDARPAGDHPRHRRRARARALGIEPGRVSPERGPRRLRRAAADSRADRARLELRRRARRDPADDGLHDAHAGAGRARRVPVPARREASRRLLGHARAEPRSVPRARVVRQRRRPAVQHDGARPALGRRGQRRQPAARRGHARRCGRRCGPASPERAAGDVGHQRRARADVDRRRPGGAVRAASRAPTGSTVTTIRRCGSGCSRFPTRSCGRCGRRCGATCSRSSASARGSAGPSSASARRASSPPARCSIPSR